MLAPGVLLLSRRDSLIAPHSVYNQHAIPESVVLRNKRRQGVMVVVVVVAVASCIEEEVAGARWARVCRMLCAPHQDVPQV